MERLRGFRYNFVVSVRSDAMFVLPSPRLDRLASFSNASWIAWSPRGQDHGGINDRFGIVGRDIADTYFGRYELIMRGGIARLLSRKQTHLFCNCASMIFQIVGSVG